MKRSEQVVVAEVDGAPRLLDLRTLTYLALNETGARIWELLVDEIGAEGIVRRLAAEYDAPEPVLRAGTDAFLRDLHERGFLDGFSGAASG
jgi:hypothetical protein